ncbi:hypothetical protein [Staphylospora marina]|uniref:hypothetical protein n=1 Tax=Staphylospora marina TaxID=2490858 RepID=UPI000F5BE6E4|nr:hypothetical protein [Staphylospora marina]
MGQDCSVFSVWMGQCSLWEMFTGEVIVGLLTVVVAVIAVMVAVKQIQKQEELTRDQLKKQEELTREQISATMEATQKQLDEMRKAQEPEVRIVLKRLINENIKRRFFDGLLIEIVNIKNVPVFVIENQIVVDYFTEHDHFDGNYFNRYRFLRYELVPQLVETKILMMGQSHQLVLDRSFFVKLFDNKTLEVVNELRQRRHPDSPAKFDLRREEIRKVSVRLEFPLTQAKVVLELSKNDSGTFSIEAKGYSGEEKVIDMFTSRAFTLEDLDEE